MTEFILVMAMTDENYVTRQELERLRDDVMPRLLQLEKDVLLIPETLKVIEFKIDVISNMANSQKKTMDQATSKVLKWAIGGIVTFVTAALGMAVSIIVSDGFNLAETAAKVIN